MKKKKLKKIILKTRFSFTFFLFSLLNRKLNLDLISFLHLNCTFRGLSIGCVAAAVWKGCGCGDSVKLFHQTVAYAHRGKSVDEMRKYIFANEFDRQRQQAELKKFHRLSFKAGSRGLSQKCIKNSAGEFE